MPCYDGHTAYLEEQERIAREKDPVGYAQKDAVMYVNALAQKAHTLTDMLCRIMAELEANQDHPTRFADGHIDADILKWWEAHKKWDEERKK